METILFICDLAGFCGGTEEYVFKTYKSLKNLGYKVYIIASKSTESPWEKDCNIIITPELLLKDRKNFNNIKNIIKNINPDVVYLHNLQQINLRKLYKILKFYPTVRFIHDARDFCINQYKLKNYLKPCNSYLGIHCLFCSKLFLQFILKPKTKLIQLKDIVYAVWFNKKMTKLIVATQYMKKILIKNRIPASKIIVLPYFIQIPEIKQEEVTFENFILYVGQIQHHKGIHYLIKSLKFVNDELKLYIIGNGPFLSYLKNLVCDLSIEKRVIFYGWKSNKELGDFYKRCYLTCMPSFYEEPFGIVGIESLSYCKPVIAFNSGGISEWLKNTKYGFLVNRGDINTLAEKINYLYANPEIARKMGIEGRNYVMYNYTEEKHITKLITIFHEIKYTYENRD